ncbi:MAG: sigma-54 dependent transcriptional regulator [Gemmatimonadota bacterium]
MVSPQMVLISTHGMALAGAIRKGLDGTDFQGDPLRVDYLPEGAEPPGLEGVALVILTGGLQEEALRAWLSGEVREEDVPVLAVAPGEAERYRSLGIQEVVAPPGDSEEVIMLARRVMERRRLQDTMGIVGETEAIREALERVVHFARVPSTVLITGESGTGKELVARGIHSLSARRHRPFIAVNVAALTETLLESELFGHEKGAFTGAVDARKGLFELANKGTIFLDEIGEMPLATQTKLLRVLEQRAFLRVGGERPITVDVRIIAATNRELREMVMDRHFRRDLFYRLNVLSVELPPLRDRRADIPLLVRTFIRDVGAQLDRPFVGIAPEAMDILIRHSWPGNIRELRNLVESMVVLAPGKVIQPQDIPKEVREPEAGRSLLPVPRRPPGLPASPDSHRDDGQTEVARSVARPELEFIFRTLVELRVDVDQLHDEFEEYRAAIRSGEVEAPTGPTPSSWELHRKEIPWSPSSAWEAGLPGGEGKPPEGELAYSQQRSDQPDLEFPSRLAEEEDGEDGVVIYRPGMTMEEMERETIRSALQRLRGNRRRTAEELGIGERTLYRKIGKFGLDDPREGGSGASEPPQDD